MRISYKAVSSFHRFFCSSLNHTALFSMLVASLIFSPLRSTAGSLTGSYAAITNGSIVNLTTNGPADWVHWGLTNTSTAVDRKAAVPPQISNYTLIYTNGLVWDIDAFPYGDNLFGYSWSDGAPTSSATNTTTGMYAFCSTSPESTGFQITAPADIRPRTLKVYVGVFAANGLLTADLSDGSTATYVNASLDDKNGGANAVYTLTYAANSPGQSLRVRWSLLVSHGSTQKVPNVTLQAAALSTPGIDIPPAVSLTTPSNTTQYAIGQAVSFLAAATDLDGTVTNVSFFSDGAKVGEVTNAPFSLDWNGAAPGLHRLTAVATDNAGSSWTSVTNEIFVHRPGGYLTGTLTTPPPALSVDLTAAGTLDWLNWGLSSASSVDRKSGVAPVLANFTQLGTNALQQFTDGSVQWLWSDGTPTPSNVGSFTGIFVDGAASGFDFAIPASTAPQTLRLYAGLYGAQSFFRAWLSDSAAPAFYGGLQTDAYHTQDGCFEIHFAASSPGQHLLIHYQNAALYDVIYGNTRLLSATLQPDTSVVLPMQLHLPSVQDTAFVFSLNTVSNHLYTLEGTDTLPATNWTTLGSFYGTGDLLTVTNPVTIPGAYFYRVRAQ